MIDFLKGKVTPKDWVAIALFMGVTAALVAAFYLLVYKEQQTLITSKLETNAKVQADLDKAREIDANIESYENETAEIRKLVQEFEDRLPSKREITSLLRDFEELASAEDVKIATSPLRRNIQGMKETIPYKIEATGSYHQVARFINRLERFRRYLKITDLEMTPNVDGVTTFKFTLNTYRFLQPTEMEDSQ